MTTTIRMYCTVLLTVALVARCTGRPAVIGNHIHDGNVGAADKGEPKVEHSVIEVSQGDTAVLQCPSNDEHHRFQFWWMKPDQIIGPGTSLNSDKFRYEVLTGTLYIKVFILPIKILGYYHIIEVILKKNKNWNIIFLKNMETNHEIDHNLSTYFL